MGWHRRLERIWGHTRSLARCGSAAILGRTGEAYVYADGQTFSTLRDFLEGSIRLRICRDVNVD
ncbi:MAG: hypothetical protein QHJ82_01465 [Verrucomicrobiota bacterium]|nr:hypothetical protein [Verrucomicrobiota bacterium]